MDDVDSVHTVLVREFDLTNPLTCLHPFGLETALRIGHILQCFVNGDAFIYPSAVNESKCVDASHLSIIYLFTKHCHICSILGVLQRLNKARLVKKQHMDTV